MWQTIKKYKWYLISVILLSIFYFASRLVNLTYLPIFTDEAIYIRWAQIGSHDANWRFISLTDGKQPLFVWAMMATVRLFSDPLFAGRIVSVFTGFLSMIGVGLLTTKLFQNKKAGIIASVFYATSPFALMYDRLALMDSTVAMFSIWSLYLLICLVREKRMDTALFLGMSLGGGVLTKTSGFLSIYLLPFSLLLFDFSSKIWRVKLVRLLALMGLAVVLSQVFYSILRLSPWFHMISQKDTTFIYPFHEWIHHPFQFFSDNIRSLSEWMIGYLTLPLVLFIIISFSQIKSKWREIFLLLVWSLAPLAGLALFGKVLYPRFIFFMALPLFVLAAYGLVTVLRKYNLKTIPSFVVLLLVVFYPLYVQGNILFNVISAPIPDADRSQYISDVFSGWGVREVNDRLEQFARDEQITVFTDGTFGLMPYGIEIYLVDNPNIRIIGIWPPPSEYTEEMKQQISEKTTYYVSNERQELPAAWKAELIDEWQKGAREDRYLRLYRLYALDED